MSQPAFSGDIPRFYDYGMGPAVFEPYAVEVARRVHWTPGIRLLEIAAGTGRVTRQLLANMPDDSEIVATDLSPAMLKVAQESLHDARVKWQVADAQDLPFSNSDFDAVVFQFGIMFLPDKPLGYREARRVLRTGGTLHLAVWRSLDQNPWAKVVRETVQTMVPDRPLGPAIPFSYDDVASIEAELKQAGFRDIQVDRVPRELVSETALQLAQGQILGSTMFNVLSEVDGIDLAHCVDKVASALVKHFGNHPLKSPMEAVLIEAVAN